MSRFINKLSLRSNLNLLESIAKMLKLSKFMAQLHCNRWPKIVWPFNVFKVFNVFVKYGCLTFLRCFSVRLEISLCSAALIKVTQSFSKISNLAFTTRVTINYFAEKCFLKWIFKSKKHVKSTLTSKKLLSVYNL